MRYAIIDVGTNSIKLLIAEKEKNRDFSFINDEIDITRLGEGISDDNLLQEKAMSRTIEGIKNFYQKIVVQNVPRENIFLKGTMCLRKAKNSSLFKEMLFHETGLDIDIISGDEEARLSYLAAYELTKENSKANLIFDIGGGSTEFILGRGKDLIYKKSINIGAVVITEKYLGFDKVNSTQMESAQKYIATLIKNEILTELLQINEPIENIIGIGGTVTTMGAIQEKMIKYNPDIIQGLSIDSKQVIQQISNFANKDIEEKIKIPGLSPKRADIILGGVLIVEQILQLFTKNHFIISNQALRHGVFYDILEK